MQHLPLLFFLFAIIVGFGFVGLLIYLNARYRHPLLRFALIQQIAFSFYMTLHSISLYGFINTDLYSDFFNAIIANTILSLYFIGPMIYYQGRTFLFVAGVDWTKTIKYSVLFFAVIPSAMATLVLLKFINPVTGTISMGIWFLSQISYYIVLGTKYRYIDDLLFKYIAKVMFIFPLFYLPIVILEGIMQMNQIQSSQYPKGIMAQPLTYLLTNIATIIVLFKANSLYKNDTNTLTRTFILDYKITNREQEIIEMIQLGLSNKEIASKLFLSPSTVRNHISNIFEKTEISSRGKLQNLINNTASK
ncbi:MAG: LuxR C-terminal-related transcriptional regulator [Leptospirales bacterium]